MKKVLPRLLFLAFLFLLCQQLFANTVIIKGRIKDSQGNPVMSWPVQVSIDSSTSANCTGNHRIITNAEGYYYDTVTCSSSIKQLIISTYDCSNQPITHIEKVNSSNKVESNFSICAIPPVCNAVFYITKDSIKPKHLLVTAGSNTSQGDAVKSRTWYWGDGDSTKTTGNTASHNYKSDGLYTVCLKVITVKGCSSYDCDSVEIFSKCKAAFGYTGLPATAAGYGIRTFSNGTYVPAGDEIIQRKWAWGDGKSINSKDSINATHYYATPGNYKVVFTITTKQGCSDTVIQNISVPVGGLQCNASFEFEVKGRKVDFDSHNSYAGVAVHDSIISRYWSFGDSTYESGNKVNISHTYSDTGWYYVCMTIKTRQGCENTYCNVIRIEDVDSSRCKATFTDSLLPRKPGTYPVLFNSTGSSTGGGDIIVQRIWKFGDGSTTDGNKATPVHQYKSPGTYLVCLIIKSSGGCIDSFCNYTTIPPPQITCRAGFAFSISGNAVQFNSSDSSYAAAGDSIISRKWNFGDSSALQGNVPNPLHTYIKAGSYYVCLTVTTSGGCESTTCGQLYIAPVTTHCNADFSYDTTARPSIKFNSYASAAVAGDSIIQRYWQFGDGNIESGNHIDPVHHYTNAGTYTVCLYITTGSGCKDSICKTIYIPASASCQAVFSSNISNDTARFYSNESSAGAGDSIIERRWNFGDSSMSSANVVNPVHHYTRTGFYTVCLTIRTSNGCERISCKTIEIAGSQSPTCNAFFTYERTGLLKFRFNSNASTVSPGDSIIRRYWNFGDSTYLPGNVINPVKEYRHSGTYQIALTIQTAKGCTNLGWGTITIKDSLPDTGNNFKIFSMFPNPVPDKFKTILWSKLDDIKCEVTIVDAYGNKKWAKSITLPRGYTSLDVPAGVLNTGPYYLKAITKYGVQSRIFFKL